MPRPTDRRTVTRLDPETRRTQIIASAARLFETHDPLDVRFEEIADAAGVSRALVYNYFGDRGGLLAAVYLHHFDAVQQHVMDAVDPAASREDRVRATVRAYVDFASEHPGAWRILHVVRANKHQAVAAAREQRMLTLAEHWGGTPQARVVTSAVVGALETATVDWLRSSEGISPDLIAEVLHDLLWSGMQGLGRRDLIERPLP